MPALEGTYLFHGHLLDPLVSLHRTAFSPICFCLIDLVTPPACGSQCTDPFGRIGPRQLES
jgi:hypothetical protein